MVDGQQVTPNPNAAAAPSRGLVVVDLDGTLVAGNTLHIYIKLGLMQSPVTALRLGGWLAMRALRLVSHRRMKWAAMRIIKPTDELRGRFVRVVNSRLRPSVTEMLEKYRSEGARILLATAAPDTYVPWLWQDDYVATRIKDNPRRMECRGLSKLAAVRATMRDGEQLLAVITDHADDLALLSAGAKRNYLVAPDTRTLITAHMAGIPFIQIT